MQDVALLICLKVNIGTQEIKRKLNNIIFNFPQIEKFLLNRTAKYDIMPLLTQ